MTSSGSTSKRSGLCAAFSMRKTRTERPSRPARSPQHSSGATSRACVTISSMCSGANSTPRSLFRRVDRGDVVVLVVAGLAAQGLFELAHAFAQRPADLRELLGPEDDQCDGKDYDELHGSDIGHVSGSLIRGSGLLPPQRGFQSLNLFYRLGVDTTGQVLPPVVGDDEHHIALVHLARDAVRDAGDRTAGDAGEDALLVEQLAGPDDRVGVRDEDLPVQQGDVDDRRDVAVVQRAQALDRLAL